MSDMRIRAARESDAAAIAAVHVETWRSAYAGMLPDRVLTRMSRATQQRHCLRQIRGGDTLMVAEDPRRGVIGFGGCGRCRDGRFAGAGEIFTLYVLPDWQDQGYGRELLTALLRALRGTGYESAVLWVLAGNPSRFFYEAMGGARIAERNERLWGAVMPEIAYEWRPLPRPLLLGRPRVSQSDDTLRRDGGS